MTMMTTYLVATTIPVVIKGKAVVMLDIMIILVGELSKVP
jgi:hypothetical protein